MTKRTVLYDKHEKLGATFTDFGGWEMPVKYGSDLAEHRAVREIAGIFDLSHMGEIYLRGSHAGAFLDWVLVGKISTMKVGKAKYGMIVDDEAHVIDDLITYRLADEAFLVVPNASNVAFVLEAMITRMPAFKESLGSEVGDYDLVIDDATDKQSLVAVQGPRAVDIVTKVVEDGPGVAEMGYYSCLNTRVGQLPVLVARTGYTGEDGFELIVDNEGAIALWETLLEAGESTGLLPCGLAARDSLRLEAGMPLYGHELDRTITPFDPGFGRVVAFKTKEEFFAREALEAARDREPSRRLVGLRGEGRRAARAGYALVDAQGEEIGKVTSGMLSPTLGYPIAMAWVNPKFGEPGTVVNVDLRGRPLPFEVVELPFYKRQK